METHIAEIQLDGDRLIPVYRIPVDEFRTRVGVVGRTRRCANRMSRSPVIHCREV
ncbi:hypothetical protein [Actinoplanes sp. NPDC026619]|uniref:hypothetical protein n=1 Tax=Actinoplanes sp. NPDC026619 TaxID=3155798 RepID=UPI0033FC2BC8